MIMAIRNTAQSRFSKSQICTYPNFKGAVITNIEDAFASEILTQAMRSNGNNMPENGNFPLYISEQGKNKWQLTLWGEDFRLFTEFLKQHTQDDSVSDKNLKQAKLAMAIRPKIKIPINVFTRADFNNFIANSNNLSGTVLTQQILEKALTTLNPQKLKG